MGAVRSTVAVLALCAAGAAPAVAGESPLGGYCVLPPGAARAVDGDTFQWAGQRVRLRAVDAPEAGEPGHEAAMRELQRWLDRGGILRPAARDRYGRAVGVLTVDGEDVGVAMKRAGYGKATTRP